MGFRVCLTRERNTYGMVGKLKKSEQTEAFSLATTQRNSKCKNNKN